MKIPTGFSITMLLKQQKHKNELNIKNMNCLKTVLSYKRIKKNNWEYTRKVIACIFPLRYKLRCSSFL